MLEEKREVESEVSKQLFDGYVLNVVRAYPRLRAKLDDLKQVRITLTPTGGGRSSMPGDPTAAVATLQLSDREQRYLDAVEAAIRETKAYPDAEARLAIVDMLFWSRARTMAGVAIKLHMSERTVRRRRSAFLRAVARHLNL